MQLSIFRLPKTTVSGLGFVVVTILTRFSLSRFGGLKWTRTIDLTLIRRVL